MGLGAETVGEEHWDETVSAGLGSTRRQRALAKRKRNEDRVRAVAKNPRNESNSEGAQPSQEVIDEVNSTFVRLYEEGFFIEQPVSENNLASKLASAGIVLLAAPEGTSKIFSVLLFGSAAILVLTDVLFSDFEGFGDPSSWVYEILDPTTGWLYNPPTGSGYNSNPELFNKMARWMVGAGFASVLVEDFVKIINLDSLLFHNSDNLFKKDKTNVVLPQSLPIFN